MGYADLRMSASFNLWAKFVCLKRFMSYGFSALPVAVQVGEAFIWAD